MNTFELVIMCVSAVAALSLAGFLGALKALMREKARSGHLDRELAAFQERNRQLMESRDESNELVRAQAAESAGVVAEQLVARASETFKSQEEVARAHLEGQLKPVADILVKFEQHVAAIETKRDKEAGQLKEQIAQLMRASQETRSHAMGML